MKIWLRRFTKFTSFATLFLIFVGGLVKSTESGLAVPDWPLSYGSFFPPMVGGVFYEHSHRMVATFVGLLTLIQTVWIWRVEPRRWVKTLSLAALAAVILQGVLGGLTVLFFLPVPISVAHGMLAQTFFLITIMIAYSQSIERATRNSFYQINSKIIQRAVILLFAVYIQLILGAVMRHTESGLAIPDFPKMGGAWLPQFNETMLNTINLWRFERNLDFVTLNQVVYHFLHRFWACVVLIIVVILNAAAFKRVKVEPVALSTLSVLTITILFQIFLGIATVLSVKEVYTTTAHVTVGAAILGLTFLLILRASPLKWGEFKKAFFQFGSL